MTNVAIVTDSTAYLPKEIIKKYDIHVVPQVLIWGEENFRDGVDITPGEYYARLSTAKVMPSTSQATPAFFHSLYGELLEKGHDIYSVLISGVLSGTIASALQARDMLSAEGKIEVFDSQSTAMAMGFQVIEAAKVAAAGGTMAECKDAAERARQATGVVFAVDTLEFLHRGGRIGGANRFLGTALNIKPILELRDGRIEPIERVRTRKKSLERLVEIIQEKTDGKSPVHLATLHANAEDDAKVLLKLASERIDTVEQVLTEVSPVIGTHAGPGTVGLAYMAGI